jgi:hypothetical protein
MPGVQVPRTSTGTGRLTPGAGALGGGRVTAVLRKGHCRGRAALVARYWTDV